MSMYGSPRVHGQRARCRRWKDEEGSSLVLEELESSGVNSRWKPKLLDESSGGTTGGGYPLGWWLWGVSLGRDVWAHPEDLMGPP